MALQEHFEVRVLSADLMNLSRLSSLGLRQDLLADLLPQRGG